MKFAPLKLSSVYFILAPSFLNFYSMKFSLLVKESILNDLKNSQCVGEPNFTLLLKIIEENSLILFTDVSTVLFYFKRG